MLSGSDSNGRGSKSNKQDKHIGEIFKALGEDRILQIYESIGFRVKNKSNGWANGSAIGREDKNPSAGVNLKTYMYSDRATGESMHMCSALVKYGGHPNYQSARLYLATAAGYKGLTKGMNEGAITNVDQEVAVNKFLQAKKPITQASLDANNVGAAKRYGKNGKTSVVIMVPSVNKYGGDVGFGFYFVPYEKGKTFGKPFTDKNNKDKHGGKDGWCGKDGIRNMSTAEIVFKVEGLTDMLALWDVIKDHRKYVVITNLNGCMETPKPDHLATLKNKNVVVIGDADEPGRDGAIKWAEAAATVAKSVRNVTLGQEIEEKHGQDIRDWVLDGGTFEELMTIVESTPKATLTRAKMYIDLDQFEPHRDVLRVRQHMIESNVPPDLFDSGGEFAMVTGDQIRQHTKSTFRTTVAKHVVFQVERGDELLPKPPPRELSDSILEYGARGFPKLNGISTAPALLESGHILCEKGYDEESGYLIEPEFDIKVSMSPTQGDAVKAKHVLGMLVKDYPFSDVASEANAMALLITAVGLPIFTRDGNSVPLFAVSASVQGSGKTHLCQLASLLGFKQDTFLTCGKQRPEEIEKKIITSLKHGQRYILLDNQPEGKPLSNDSIAAMITGSTVFGRGAYERDARVNTDVLWMATGNHLQIGDDLKRRTILIELQVDALQPSARKFRGDPHLWVKNPENRGTVYHAVYTMINAWVAAGRPVDESQESLGSFNLWAEIVAGVLAYAGVEGFRANKDKVNRGSQSEEAWHAMIQAWWTGHEDDSIHLGDLFQVDGVMDDPNIEMAMPECLAKVPAGDDQHKRRAWIMGRHLAASMKNQLFRLTTISQDGTTSPVCVKLVRGKRDKISISWKLERFGESTKNRPDNGKNAPDFTDDVF